MNSSITSNFLLTIISLSLIVLATLALTERLDLVPATQSARNNPNVEYAANFTIPIGTMEEDGFEAFISVVISGETNLDGFEKLLDKYQSEDEEDFGRIRSPLETASIKM